MQSEMNIFQKYFGVVTQGKTYLKLLYLALAFPLGLTYFILLIVGFSLGLSLIIIWIGVVILAIMFPLVWVLIAFERLQAIHLLGQQVAPMEKQKTAQMGLWERTKSFFTNPVTWKGSLYLFLKFPIGLVAFIFFTVSIAILAAMITAPLTYPWGITLNFLGLVTLDTMSEALAFCILGVLLFPAFLHISNFFADLNGKFAGIMLGQTEYITSPEEHNIDKENESSDFDASNLIAS